MVRSILDLDKVKLVAVHYIEITTYEFDYDDKVTLNLIYWFKDIIFSCDLDSNYIKELINQIDYILYRYISEIDFQSSLNKCLDGLDIRRENTNEILNILFDFTFRYQNDEVFNIKGSKWIV